MQNDNIKFKMRGIATLEMLIAMAIIVLSISSVLPLVSGSQSTSTDSQTNQEALYKTVASLENARATAKQGFNLVAPIPDGPDTDSFYNKGLSVGSDPTDPSNPDKKLVTANTTWNMDGRNLAVHLTTLLTNPVLGGDTCNPTLSGDWSHPQLLGHADMGTDNGGTDVYVQAGKAYVTTNSSAPNKPDFWIVDVSDPNLTPLPDFGPNSKINTGPGLAAIHVAGRYAYVANMSTTSQLQVIDISTPSAPIVVASLDVTAIGDPAVGNSIFYANRKIYLGLTKSDGPEFYVIDVSNPTSLSASSVMATFETDTRINAITVKNNVAYLATPWPDSLPSTQENLSILDVSHPSLGITRINTFTYPDPSTLSGESVYISKDGKTLYLGRGGLNSANNPEFFSLDVTNPSAVPIPVLNSKFIDASVNAITVRSNLAFLWTNDTNREFKIWDLGSLSLYASLNMEQSATGGLDCAGNLLYTAQRSNKALQIVGPAADLYTLSNSGDITVIQGASVSNTITRTWVTGNPPADTLTLSGLPAGASVAWTNNPCSVNRTNPTCLTQLSITTTSPTTLVGTYAITVIGAGGASTTFNLVVNPPFDYTLSTPANVTVVRAGTTGSNTVTVTMTPSATPQTVTITPRTSDLPSGVTVSPASRSCTPSATNPYQCTTAAFTYTAAPNVTVGGPVTVHIDGVNPAHSTSFNLTVNAPAFSYILANIGNITVIKGGPAVTNTITITMTAGAVPQLVTLSNSALASGLSVTYSPISKACNPNATSPYTCTVVLSFTASSSAPNSNAIVTITGTSVGVGPKTTSFKVKVQ